MKSLFGYLCLIFSAMFWVFRIVATLLFSLGVDFFVQPLNYHVEIVLLFATLVFLLLIGKRRLIGAICYLLAYGAYFGVDIYNNVIGIINGNSLDPNQFMSVFVSFIGIVLPILTVMELLFDRSRKLDERADKNNYKIY